MKKKYSKSELSGVRSLLDYVKTNEIDRIVGFHKRLFPSDHLPKIDDNNDYWFAYVGQRIAGFCILRTLDGGVGFLCRSGVFKKYSGLGIQRDMVRVRERFARVKGLTTMITYTSMDNYRSMSNLIRCGYQLYTPGWKYAGSTCLYFIKQLKEGE